jgi:hypothetical protein
MSNNITINGKNEIYTKFIKDMADIIYGKIYSTRRNMSLVKWNKFSTDDKYKIMTHLQPQMNKLLDATIN